MTGSGRGTISCRRNLVRRDRATYGAVKSRLVAAARRYGMQDVEVVRTVDEELPRRALFHPHNAVSGERVGARQHRSELNHGGASPNEQLVNLRDALQRWME